MTHVIACLLLLLLALLPVAGLAPALAQETPRPGGVIKAAMIGEPPALDMHWTTAVLTQQIVWHVYETLYTFDHAFNPIPMLAEGHTVADNGRRYTIRLRRGVKFHNGKEMTAADVIPSLTRWGRIAAIGKPQWKNVEAIEAKDPYTVQISLKEPAVAFLHALARPGNGAAIYPKEVAEAAGDAAVKEVIGTGPYRFVEHKPDRHIKVARFREYAARTEAPDGYGGRRTAWADEILFLPVSDVAVRLAGVESGEYHYAQQIKPDHYERIKGLPQVVPIVVRPTAWSTAVLNHKQGMMADKRIRQAVQAALDMEPIMAAGFGHKDFYRLDASLFFAEQPFWHSRVAAERYNQKDKAKAARLLREAGYGGQPVRWLTTKEYEHFYRTALVARQQLEEAGLKVDLQVLDWATLVQRRNKPELWDVFSTFFAFVPDPVIFTGIQCNWPGWWCHEEKERLMEALSKESDPKKRKALWERVQVVFYEDVGRIKLGDFFGLDVTRKELRGFQSTPEPFLWNTWLGGR